MRTPGDLPRQTEFHILIFCLFFTLAGWPFLASAGASGVAGLFTYLLVIWGMLIVILFLINRSLIKPEHGQTDAEEGRGGESDV